VYSLYKVSAMFSVYLSVENAIAKRAETMAIRIACKEKEQKYVKHFRHLFLAKFFLLYMDFLELCKLFNVSLLKNELNILSYKWIFSYFLKSSKIFFFSERTIDDVRNKTVSNKTLPFFSNCNL